MYAGGIVPPEERSETQMAQINKSDITDAVCEKVRDIMGLNHLISARIIVKYDQETFTVVTAKVELAAVTHKEVVE